jgi:pyridoxine kinase
MKKIALINDLSGFGRCSLTAAIPVISALGVQACPLPTAILSAQTGFNGYYYDDYTSNMNMITDKWADMNEHFDGIYSGYLGSDAQMDNVLYFLEKFHLNNTIYLCDPIMGDNGVKFPIFTPKLLDSMKALSKQADVITPNLTELCLLCGVDFDELVSHSADEDYCERISDMAHSLMDNSNKNQIVIVTGILSQNNDVTYIGNLAVTDIYSYYEKSPYTGKSFSGTGDLFASVIAGCLVKGLPISQAVDKAIAFLTPAIEEASINNEDRNQGVYFEKYLGLLTDCDNNSPNTTFC